MTDEAQRIAILEWSGWYWDEPTSTWIWIHGRPPTIKTDFDLSDLNAIHEVEEKLSHDEWRIFLGFLMGERTIPKLASMEEFHKAWNTTARQRCEALLRTIGKWVES